MAQRMTIQRLRFAGCGVYSITCVPTGEIYLGSSNNFTRRWAEHQTELNEGIHANYKLQQAWDMFGPTAFLFEVVERCQPEQRFAREQWWIDCMHPRLNIQKYVVMPPMKTGQARVTQARKQLMKKHLKARYT